REAGIVSGFFPAQDLALGVVHKIHHTAALFVFDLAQVAVDVIVVDGGAGLPAVIGPVGGGAGNGDLGLLVVTGPPVLVFDGGGNGVDAVEAVVDLAFEDRKSVV